MAGYKEVLDDLYDLLNANATFKNNVSRHDFSKIAESASTAAVLRVGGFGVHEDEAFGGVYAIVWDIFVDLYESYGAHIEEDVDNLVQARDTVIDLIEKNYYLGQGAGNDDGIEFANVRSGEILSVVTGEDDAVTHFSLSVHIEVRQMHDVVLAE